MIAWQNISNSKVNYEPFTWFECNQCLTEETINHLSNFFPSIHSTGSYASESLQIQSQFNEFLQQLQSKAMTDIISEKLKIPLENLNQTLTFRGYSKLTDGKPHLDSTRKLVTMLVYMNDDIWQHNGGKPRLLNSSSLDDYFAEFEPTIGKMIVFKCGAKAWHGHLPFEGKRQTIQLNWVKSNFYAVIENTRHRISALLKPSQFF